MNQPPQEVAPGLFRLRVPTPGFVANYLYLFSGPEPVLIDAGHPDAETQAALDAGLAALGLVRADLAAVLYTHTHLDHLGGGIRHWREAAEAAVPHRIAQSALDEGVDRSFGRRTRALHDWSPWLDSLPTHPRVQRWRDRRRQRSRSWLVVDEEEGRALDTRGLKDGDEVLVAGRRLQILALPGHDPHHLAFYDPQRSLLITGDLVLRTPTPLMPPMGDDAAAYRRSLARLQVLPAQLVLPAHGPTLAGEAVGAVAKAFDALAEAVLHCVRQGPTPVGPGDVLEWLFEHAPSLLSDAESLEGVMLGNVHSHLLRWLAEGTLAEEEGRFRAV